MKRKKMTAKERVQRRLTQPSEDRRDALINLLTKALESAADFTTYSSEDDSVGYRCCCGVVSYMPHGKDCELSKAIDAARRSDSEKANG